jgi:hypothetical protein
VPSPFLLVGLAGASGFLGLLIGFVVYTPGLASWQLLLVAVGASVALHDTVMMALEIIDRASRRQK